MTSLIQFFSVLRVLIHWQRCCVLMGPHFGGLRYMLQALDALRDGALYSFRS
ncbi:hypothetical protein M758_12G017100 [Ceratodon purpureus]|nr:hypothetical protein M758_12G017100 [Ceratodon purpureus]